ncbi:acyl-CoA thioesterase family protein [Francisella tularensis]|nr:hypothetical protein [Francisella tularensis]MBD5784260.1 hypothetical protein [Francisella tularensis subsp. holarctica]
MITHTFKYINNISIEDTDKYGHDNNRIYFNYFEEARTEWEYNSINLI